MAWPPPCSDWARSQRLDPIGSAGHYDGFLLVEQPLPWPSDVSEIPHLVEVARIASAARLRLQAVVPIATLGGTRARRLICYRSARPGWAGPMARSERSAEPAFLTEAARSLLDSGPPEDPGEVVDVLVCTHGRRDACCGARGMDLLGALVESQVFGQQPPVRLWRTSHTGGHRFAPTAIVLPSATLWAAADTALLAQVVSGEGSLDEVLNRYRGCASVGSPAQQAVEKAVLSEVGWPLLGSWRRAVDMGDGLVRLDTELAGTWEAQASEGRRVPQPECRTEPGLATKQSVEWVVEGLRQVVAA